jgi:hypothetical protein
MSGSSALTVTDMPLTFSGMDWVMVDLLGCVPCHLTLRRSISALA